LAVRLGDAVIFFKGDKSQLEKDTESASKNTKSSFGSLAGSLNTIIGGAIVGGVGLAVAGVVSIGTAALGVSTDFQNATNSIIKGTGASGKSLAEMEEIVKRLKGTTAGLGKDFGELGSIVAEVNTRTGATGEQLEKLSSEMATFSRLTGGDGVGQTQLVTRVMGDWGVELENSSELLDKIFGAGQAFGIGVDDLAGKLVQFGAPLRQMGFSLDDSIAMFGKWEKEGVNTELVLGSLRIAAGHFAKGMEEDLPPALSNVAKELNNAREKADRYRAELELAQEAGNTGKVEELTEKLAEQNEQVTESTLLFNKLAEDMRASGEIGADTQLSLSDSLNETIESIKNAKSESEGLSIAMEVFGAKAGPDMAAAIREGRFELEGAIGALAGTSGGLQDAADRALTMGERFEIMKSKAMTSLMPIGDMLLGLGETAMPTLQTFVDWIAGTAVPWITELFTQMGTLFGESGIIEAFQSYQEIFSAVFDSISEALGVSSENFSGMEVILWLVEKVFKAVAVQIQLAGVIFYGIGAAIKFVIDKVKEVIFFIQQFQEKLANLQVPEFLKMHSPPPLAQALGMVKDEVQGLKNIALPGLVDPAQQGGEGQPAATGGGGGGPQIIQLVVDGQVLAQVVNTHLGGLAAAGA